MINAECFLQLYPGSTRLVEFAAIGPKRTRIKIEADRSTDATNSMPEVTLTEFTYDRLRLQEFFALSPVINIEGLYLPITTQTIVEILAERTGIFFTLDDFIHEELKAYTGNNNYTLVANPKSLRWTGFLQIKLTNTVKEDLATLTTGLSFPSLLSLPSNNKWITRFQTAGYDFTEYRAYLESIGNGVFHPSAKKLAAIMAKVTKQTWVAMPVTVSRNIVHSVIDGELHYKVIYNGPAWDRFTVRTDMRKVMVIELSGEYCVEQDQTGWLLLHYN
jgi:hypothetical protein